MTNLVIYTNNQYYLLNFCYNSSQGTNMNTLYPKLNNIIPKYMIHVDNRSTFTLDINGSVHALAYYTSHSSLGLYNNLYCTSIANCILMKIYAADLTYRIILFEFNEETHTIVMETTKISWFDEQSMYKKHKSTFKYIRNIQSYEITKHNSIVLKGFNNDIYVYNGSQQFDVFYNVNHKLYVNSRIYIEEDKVLYKSVRTIINKTNTLVKGGKVKNIPDGTFYCYSRRYRSNISISIEHNSIKYKGMGFNEVINKVDTSTYITMIEIDASVFLIFSNEIIFFGLYSLSSLRLQLNDIIITDDLVAHGLAARFVWTVSTHKYLSKYRKTLVDTIILSNKYTRYCKVPKYILLNIIGCAFSCYH